METPKSILSKKNIPDPPPPPQEPEPKPKSTEAVGKINERRVKS